MSWRGSTTIDSAKQRSISERLLRKWLMQRPADAHLRRRCLTDDSTTCNDDDSPTDDSTTYDDDDDSCCTDTWGWGCTIDGGDAR